MKDIPKVFDCRPVAKEILQVLGKYPVSYFYLNEILNLVRTDIDLLTPIVIDPKIMNDSL